MGKYYAGLDVSQANTSICVVTSNGLPLLETVTTTDPQSIATVDSAPETGAAIGK